MEANVAILSGEDYPATEACQRGYEAGSRMLVGGVGEPLIGHLHTDVGRRDRGRAAGVVLRSVDGMRVGIADHFGCRGEVGMGVTWQNFAVTTSPEHEQRLARPRVAAPRP